MSAAGQKMMEAADGRTQVYFIGELTLDDDSTEEVIFSENTNPQTKRASSGQSMRVGPDGSIYLCGYYAEGGANDSILVVKIGSGGTVAWAKRYYLSSGGSLVMGSIDITADGSALYLAVNADTGTNERLAVIKLSSSDGSITWSVNNTSDDLSGNMLPRVLCMSDGDVVAYAFETGTTTYLSRLDSSGTAQFSRRIASSSDEEIKEMVEDSNGDLICAGCDFESFDELYIAKFAGDNSSAEGYRYAAVSDNSTFTGVAINSNDDALWVGTNETVKACFYLANSSAISTKIELQELSLGGASAAADNCMAVAVTNDDNFVVVIGRSMNITTTTLNVLKMSSTDLSVIWNKKIDIDGTGVNFNGFTASVGVNPVTGEIVVSSIVQLDSQDSFVVFKLKDDGTGEPADFTSESVALENQYTMADEATYTTPTDFTKSATSSVENNTTSRTWASLANVTSADVNVTFTIAGL